MRVDRTQEGLGARLRVFAARIIVRLAFLLLRLAFALHRERILDTGGLKHALRFSRALQRFSWRLWSLAPPKR